MLTTGQLGSSKLASKGVIQPPRPDELDRFQNTLLDRPDHGIISAIDGEDGSQELSDVSAVPPTSTTNLNAVPKRRRKRNKDEDDIEGMYMQRLAEEDSKTTSKRDFEGSNKRQKLQAASHKPHRNTSPNDFGSEASATDSDRRESNSGSGIDIPRHESLSSSRETVELEKAARTVFLANVSTSAIKSKNAKKVLLSHLTSYCSALSTKDQKHKIESLRFRSTPFPSGVGPKKAAYAKKELMDSTTTSTNAYVVYSTQLAAREAVKRLNGTLVLDRHLLVDSVSHPRKVDHRRCVFVGNLGFVDDESQMNAAKDDNADKKPRKKKEPSDVEEGLWRQFGKAGSVESVRVVRDGTNRVGKGFAYVQFQVCQARFQTPAWQLIFHF